MKNKITFLSLAVLVWSLTAILPSGYAYGFHHKQSKCADSLDSWSSRFFKKAHTILENSEKLGLTEEKIEAIKNLKLETEKNAITKNAEIEVVQLDLMDKIHDETPIAGAVSKLIDQKYDLEKEQAKMLADATLKLKALLSKDQNEQLKKIWHHEKSERCTKEESSAQS